MNTDRINELKNRAVGVRDASAEGENTATRVGQLMWDMIDYDYNQSTAITNLENKTTSLQKQINELGPGGGGGEGGGSTSGHQDTFYLNLPHSDSAPELPSVSEYNAPAKSFIHGSQVWTFNNVNPGEGEDTWQIYAWIVGDEAKSIGGPVRIYNSAQGGSNGEDGEETEWIYYRSTSKIDYSGTAGETVVQALANYNGTTKIEGSHNFGGQTWTDHPQGIDEINRYEYRSYRESSLDANGKRVWGATGFSFPVLYSAYGEKGEDGDGVEYIYYASMDGTIDLPINQPENWNNETTGKEGKTFQDNEFIAEGSDWMDNPIDIKDPENGFGPGAIEYVSTRKKINGVWQQFTEAKFWTRYAEDGVVDGYTVDFVNDNMIVNTNEDGTVGNYSNRGYVQVFHNSMPLAYTDDTTLDSGHFTYEVTNITCSNASIVSAIHVEKHGDNKSQVDVTVDSGTNFLDVNAHVTLTVYLPNSTTRMLDFSLYGIVGAEPIDMFLGARALRYNPKTNTVTPASIPVGVTIGTQTYLSQSYIGTPIAGSAEALGYTFQYKFDANNFTSSMGDIDTRGKHDTLTVRMLKSGHMVDEETVSYISDGADGRGIISTTAYYKAFSSDSGNHNFNIGESGVATKPEDTSWGESDKYLYRRDYTVYSNEEGWNGDAYLYQVWLSGGGSGEATCVISSQNDNAVIDDQTTNADALKTATNNVLTVWKGNTDITDQCDYEVVSLSLPSNMRLYTLYPGTQNAQNIYNINSSCGNTNFLQPYGSPTKFTSGNYYYDIKVTHNNTVIGTKRFKLYIDANVSTDGSFYKLSIENDTVGYTSEGVRLDASTYPIIHAYRITNDGTSEEVSITPIKSIGGTSSLSNNKLYVTVGNELWDALFNGGETYGGVKLSRSEYLQYSSAGYDITLYKGENYVDGPEHIDCRKDGKDGTDGSGSDGYSLIVTPSYAVFDEPISDNPVEQDGMLVYKAGAIDTSGWSASVRVLKGKTPMRIGYSREDFVQRICTCSIGWDTSSDPANTALKVTISSITDSEETNGLISFWVTENPGNTVESGSRIIKVDIPIYINRIGSRLMTIAGDVETVIMSKTAYIDAEDKVVTYGNLAEHVKSSEVNISSLTTSVDGAVTASSTALQTANNINLSVSSGYKNYIVSPLAYPLTQINETAVDKKTHDSNAFGFTSRDIGQVAKIAPSSSSTGHTLIYTAEDGYRANLNSEKVVIYALVRCGAEASDSAIKYFNFGFCADINNTSTGALRALEVQSVYNNGTRTINVVNNHEMGITTKVGTVQLTNTDWYLCYRVFTLSSDSYGNNNSKKFTVNNVSGTWFVHSVGLSKGSVPPTIESVILNSGTKSAGIDITSGKIELKADNTTITDSTTTSKIEVTPGPDLTGSYNGLETFKIDTYDAGTSSDNVAGAVFTLNEVGQNSNNSQTMIRPQAIIINSGSNTIQIDAYHGRITIRNGGTGTGTAVIRSTSNGYICIDGIPHGYSHFDPIMDINALYYDDQGYVHIHKPTLQAPAAEDPTENWEITEDGEQAGEITDVSGGETAGESGEGGSGSEGSGTEGSDAPALDLDLTGEVDESTGENTPTNEETTTNGEE